MKKNFLLAVLIIAVLLFEFFIFKGFIDSVSIGQEAEAVTIIAN